MRRWKKEESVRGTVECITNENRKEWACAGVGRDDSGAKVVEILDQEESFILETPRCRAVGSVAFPVSTNLLRHG